MYEDVLYKKPFLKEVICRIDFPSPLPGIDKSLPNNLSRIALQHFPIAEAKPLHTQEFKFEGDKVSQSEEQSTQWDFHGREREKTLTIVPDSIMVKAVKYESFDPFIDEFLQILDILFQEHKDTFSSRIGLRYVNIVDIDEDDPLEWSNYINSALLGVVDFPSDKKTVSRAFNILEFNIDGQAIKFQCGIANPDYPAVVKRKQFVLDIDSYFHGSFLLPEIKENLYTAHNKIQEIFENSVTDGTRKLMVPKNDA